MAEKKRRSYQGKTLFFKYFLLFFSSTKNVRTEIPRETILNREDKSHVDIPGNDFF